MSNQGPGGYGGGQPPGGWGPPPGSPPGAPPGAPPGGYGPPPGGGYGQPPGGYGQPPGAPQGWQPAAPGVAPTQPGNVRPPSKKANPVVWLGLGCGLLLFLGAAGAAWFYFSVFKPAQAVAEAASAAASNLGATVSVGSSGVTVNIPGLGQVTAPTATTPGAPAPSITVKLPSAAAKPGATASAPSAAASSPAGAPTLVPPAASGVLTPGGPSCVAAAACCKAMASKAGGQAQTVAGCDALQKSPEFACAQALATYKKMAPLVGVTCP